jgi:hypothetical protein
LHARQFFVFAVEKLHRQSQRLHSQSRTEAQDYNRPAEHVLAENLIAESEWSEPKAREEVDEKGMIQAVKTAHRRVDID